MRSLHWNTPWDAASWAAAMFSCSSPFEQVARDDLPLHFARALVNSKRADVAVELLDLDPAGDFGAPAHLHRIVDDPLRGFGGIQLIHRHGTAVVGVRPGGANVLLPGRPVDEQGGC